MNLCEPADNKQALLNEVSKTLLHELDLSEQLREVMCEVIFSLLSPLPLWLSDP